MSKASVTGQIVVTSDGTTINPILQCTTGDVYQNYNGEWNSPSSISPNFEANGAVKPKLVMQAFSAMQGAGNSFDLTKGVATWYAAGVALSFDGTGTSANSFGGMTGHFTKGVDSKGNPTLRVNENLVGVNSGDSFNIE